MSILQNNNLLIVGAGQYGAVAFEIAQSMNRFGTIAFLDDSFHDDALTVCSDKLDSEAPTSQSQQEHPLPCCPRIIGSTRDIEKFAGEFRYGFVAIGNPKVRRRLTENLRYNCIIPAILVHPQAYVSPSAQLQMGCCIEPHATVQAESVVATASFIASGAVVRHDAFVGGFCHVDCNAVVESTAIVPNETKVCCNSVFCKEQNS